MSMSRDKTLFDKLWDRHVIVSDSHGMDLIHIDRSLLTDLAGTMGLEDIRDEELRVSIPSLHAALPDHVIETAPAASVADQRLRERFVVGLDDLSQNYGIRHFPRGSGRQGIVHVFGLEQGFSLPGLTVVCGDSHTPTHGAIGALAWGIGSTDVKHVLATQTLWMKRPKTARVWIGGDLAPGVFAKDLILWLIGQLGTGFGVGHAIEFVGPAIAGLSVEGRATICNLAVELGAPYAIIAPDQKVFEYLNNRDFTPKGSMWNSAVADWASLSSDPHAEFDKYAQFDACQVTPQITWGTSPQDVLSLSEEVPNGELAAAARSYMGLDAGQSLSQLSVDVVFIGSCANGRLEDLRVAADIVRDRTIAPHVRGLVVAGSEAVKQEAEAEGLDEVFTKAGFEWREPGCSMCVAVNGDIAASGERVVSTSNRNFIGRQGTGARTHLASPATAAASAITGMLTPAIQLSAYR